MSNKSERIARTLTKVRVNLELALDACAMADEEETMIQINKAINGLDLLGSLSTEYAETAELDFSEPDYEDLPEPEDYDDDGDDEDRDA